MLDRVQIDGNRNDPFVGRDPELGLAKVEPAGIVPGDDFNRQAAAQGAPLRRAVEAVVARLGSAVGFRLMGNQDILRLRPSGLAPARSAARRACGIFRFPGAAA